MSGAPLRKVTEQSLRGLSTGDVTCSLEAWALESGNGWPLRPVPSSLGSWCRGPPLTLLSRQGLYQWVYHTHEDAQEARDSQEAPGEDPQPDSGNGTGGQCGRDPGGDRPALFRCRWLCITFSLQLSQSTTNLWLRTCVCHFSYWRPEVQSESLWAICQVSAELCSFLGLWAGEFIYSPLSVSRSCLQALARGPFLYLQSRRCWSESPSLCPLCNSDFSASVFT